MLPSSLFEVDRAISHWINSSGLPIEELVRLLLAALVGGLVGLEREMRGREAGFRTNLLVCVGSALVMIVSISLASGDWHSNGRFTITVDPGRIAYGVMAGVGFLGAGTIIQHGRSVRGLTTAAGLWCVAAAGLAAGFGLYLLCIASAVIILTALWALDYFEDILPRTRYRTIVIRVPWHAGCITEIVDFFKQRRFHISDVSYYRTPDLAATDVSLHIAFINRHQYYNVERQLQQHPEWQLLGDREP